MSSYRLARRAFLGAIGGAVGLRLMLDQLESVARGVIPSPPRFLLTHFPIGTLRSAFLPQGVGADYVPSEITQPFEAAQLRGDMTIFYGFSDAHLSCPGGGAAESGTPFTTTCCSAEGTRSNGGESDDGVAGGPSFDQIFLERVPGMKRGDAGPGYANAICDARVDSNETSVQCLSYGYQTASISSTVPGGLITEYTPLLPELSPAALYASLFANFIPGGSTDANQQAALLALQMRKSVLDSSLTELARLKRIAPASEAPKLDIHADIIRQTETQLAEQIESGSIDTGSCQPPAAPPADLVGQRGNSPYLTDVETDDSPLHRQIGLTHAAVLLAAFQCDLIRSGTLQFAPGNSHVSFGGMWPSDPTRIAMHHPVTHTSSILGGGASQPPPEGGEALDVYRFLVNVQVWYNTLLAEILVNFKQATDVFGNSILDTTVIPYVTEIAEPTGFRSPKPAYLFGGSALGLQHGTFQDFSQTRRPQVDLYLTAAQALLGSSDVMSTLGDERFVQFNPDAAIIDGLWRAPG